jgi:uncharacterized protein (TIGR02466 family)
MSEPNIINLFPTAILDSKLDREFTQVELDYFNNVQHGVVPNIGNRFTANNYVLEDLELKSLKDFFQAQLDTYMNIVFKPKHQVSLRITQSWINVSQPGEFHHRHKHPNSFISGVFYIQANKNTDQIVFDRDRYDQITIHSDEFTFWNSNTWWLPAETYQLYLFPSHLTHFVETVLGNQNRISLSFNTFPTGVLGNQAGLTELKV